MKIMFSVQFGDSIAHVLRTRWIAHKLKQDGHLIKYIVSGRAHHLLDGYLKVNDISDNRQSYGFSRLDPINILKNKFADRAVIEYLLYSEFNPDIVIGDMGLIPSVYCNDKPLIKIINRFFVDLYSPCDSVLDRYICGTLIQQIEDLVNHARRRIKITANFKYAELFKGNALINGLPSFVDLKYPIGKVIGIKIGIKMPSNFTPDNDVVFISFGTGSGNNKQNKIKKVLSIVTKYYKKIYLSTGKDVDIESLDLPRNVTAMRLYDTLPSDVGSLICHGGYAAIHMGMILNIPIYILPFQIEQYSNGCRLEQMNLGKQFGIIEQKQFLGLSHNIKIDWHGFEAAISDPIIIHNNFCYDNALSDFDLYLTINKELDLISKNV